MISNNTLRANIKYVTREAIKVKPDNFTTGGYTVVNPDGGLICFDWSEMSANSKILEDGKVEIEADLKDFDWEAYEENEKHITNLLSIPIYKITEFNIDEVYYECSIGNDEQEKSIELDLIEFSLYDSYSGKSYSFSKETIDRYNSQKNGGTSICFN